MGTGKTDEFRKDAVRIALTSGLTRKQIAEDPGVGVLTLNKLIMAHRGTDGRDDVVNPGDTPLFLRAMCEGLQVSLGKPGATASSVGTVMALGDVAMLPAFDGAIALHLQVGGQVSSLAETWEITPYSDTCAAHGAMEGMEGMLIVVF